MDTQLNQVFSSFAPTAPTFPKKPQKKYHKYIYFFIGAVILSFLLMRGAYFLGKKSAPSLYQQSSSSNINKPTIPITNLPSYNNLFTGKVKELNQDLGLIIPTEEEKLNNITPQVFYYEAGIYTQGNYKGYTRYVALRESISLFGTAQYIFASKDQKTYILDSESLSVVSADPLEEINKSKVSKTDRLDSDHAPIISLNERFALNKNHLLIEVRKTAKKDQYGDFIQESFLNTDFSGYKSLKSTTPKLAFYTTAYYDKSVYEDGPTNLPTETKNQYIDGTTEVIVVDETGLAFSYDQANPQQAEAYLKAVARYKKAYADYYKSLRSAFTEKPQDIQDYPHIPSLRLTKQEIQTQVSIYDTYGVALPGSCAIDANTLVVKNISDQELQKIGDSPNGELYIVVDKDHPLYKAEFNQKIGRIDDETFIAINERKKPSYDEYVSKNSLIFFKDYWGRWVVLGEYDYKLEGGCGKPVIYLYPTKPTKVYAQFISPMRLDISIPTYHNAWSVMAYPNGNLIDLQPQFTNCKDIDISKKGSEYAQDACQNNSYPYLYWAGQSLNSKYPESTQGWIVEKNNVENFMNQTLDQIGFTQKEKSDMISYWLPEMMQKDAPYYKIAFLQTSDMNKIAPMRITPQPKSVYRLFLDYLPLQSKPFFTLSPQNLPQVVRDGFTMIEWGGLKR